MIWLNLSKNNKSPLEHYNIRSSLFAWALLLMVAVVLGTSSWKILRQLLQTVILHSCHLWVWWCLLINLYFHFTKLLLKQADRGIFGRFMSLAYFAFVSWFGEFRNKLGCNYIWTRVIFEFLVFRKWNRFGVHFFVRKLQLFLCYICLAVLVLFSDRGFCVIVDATTKQQTMIEVAISLLITLRSYWLDYFNFFTFTLTDGLSFGPVLLRWLVLTTDLQLQLSILFFVLLHLGVLNFQLGVLLF